MLRRANPQGVRLVRVVGRVVRRGGLHFSIRDQRLGIRDWVLLGVAFAFRLSPFGSWVFLLAIPNHRGSTSHLLLPNGLRNPYLRPKSRRLS